MSIDLEAMVAARHEFPEWIVVYELANGTGYRGTHARYCDVAAFNTYPSTGYTRVAYEVKRTRSDFLKELDKPEKRKWLEDYFHQTIFVCAAGICDVKEIPDGWGLIIPTKKGDKLRRVKVPRTRVPPDLPETIAISAMRRCAELLRVEQRKAYTFEGEAITRADLDAKVLAATTYERERLSEEMSSLTKQRHELDELRQKLIDPFRELHKEARSRGWVRRDMGPPTPAQVRQWFWDAEAAFSRRLQAKIQTAWHAIEELRKAAEKAGGPDGEVED